MHVSLTIIRYPKRYIPVAFLAMAIHRFPLWSNRKISFFKLMGSGKNGTFDKQPDLQQWAILAVRKPVESNLNEAKEILAELYGTFISSWFKFFGCETYTLLLEPVEGHGSWDGKAAFGALDAPPVYNGPIGILTRATIRISKLRYFWQHVGPVAAKMVSAEGFLLSFGIGEVPWIKQATFSVWQSPESMKAFAYQQKEHQEVIRKTRREKWYSEDMFVRFKLLRSVGTIRGSDPLAGKL